MDAIIGRYKVRMEETGLILRHTTGLSFELTVDETLGVLNFISVYRDTLLALQDEQETDTEPRMERVFIPKGTD
jgi:hypothetical protein